ncbi:MAG: DNA polymerase IV [Zhaonellaceae bacterium]|nr:DNA polymerase IV [Clostridia bacterium]
MERGDILLCDLDAFYASVEQLDNPEIKGKPVIVGGDPGKRGVVSTCSYEARKFGVRSAMPLMTAQRLCPQGIFLKVNMPRYQEVSNKVFDIYQSFTPQIEVVSIDEAYLEVRKGQGTEIAAKIRKTVREELGLTVSIGVSSNKLLAKIASNMAKPDGLKALWPDEATRELGNCSIRIIPGIGPKTAERFRQYGIKTIAELRAQTRKWFIRHFGSRGEEIYKFVNWVDERPLVLDRERKSIGEEITFSEDIADKNQLLNVLNQISAEVGYRLRKAGYHARTLTIKVRYSDFKTTTRSKTVENLLYTDWDIYETARNLFNVLKKNKPIRLLGIQVSNFGKDIQLSLFNDENEKKARLADVVDRLNNKYGKRIISSGLGLPMKKEELR